jgi:hypothetical protein
MRLAETTMLGNIEVVAVGVRLQTLAYGRPFQDESLSFHNNIYALDGIVAITAEVPLLMNGLHIAFRIRGTYT